MCIVRSFVLSLRSRLLHSIVSFRFIVLTLYVRNSISLSSSSSSSLPLHIHIDLLLLILCIIFLHFFFRSFSSSSSSTSFGVPSIFTSHIISIHTHTQCRVYIILFLSILRPTKPKRNENLVCAFHINIDSTTIRLSHTHTHAYICI